MLYFVIAFLTGILVKTVDWLEDDRKSKHPIKYLLAGFYGILIGYLIGNATFSVLFLAAIIAQVFARKIDTRAHRIGFVIAVITLLFFELPSIDMVLFGYFLLLAFFDEVDYIGKWRWMENWRPFLQVGALALVLFGRWDYFFAIVAFDAGYILVSTLGKRFKKHKKRKKKR